VKSSQGAHSAADSAGLSRREQRHAAGSRTAPIEALAAPDSLTSTRAERSNWWAYLAAMSALTAGYGLAHFFGPGWLRSGLVFNLIGGASVAALILGARRSVPGSRLPWYLFAVGQSLFVTSDVLAYNYERLFGSALPFPSVADQFHLAFYPLLMGGLLLTIRERHERRDRAAVIDALIVTAALATLLWVYLIAPYAADHTLSVLRRLTSIAYPAMDILVLGIVARMATGSHRREPAFVLMLSGVIALLLSDAVYGVKLLGGGFAIDGMPGTGWAIYYTLMGSAALHPSMRRLSAPGPARHAQLTRARLALLACASLTVPLLIVMRAALHESLNLYVLVGASGLMFALVLLRMAEIVHRNEELGRQMIALNEERASRRSEERLGSLIKNSSDVVCILDREARINYISPSVQQALGHLPQTLIEAPLAELLHPDDSQRVHAFVASLASQPLGQPALAEFRVRHVSQGWRVVEALGTNLLEDDAIGGIVLNVRDISERKAFLAELEHQAFHDTLTELPNRALFRDRVGHALAAQRRDHLPVAVLFLDIDDFKNVNDSLGHAAGDEVLREVGRRLEDCMRTVDTAARLGGDEFAILIHETESELQAIEIAHRVMEALQGAIALAGRDVTIASSIGIAFSDHTMVSGRDAEELLRNADTAMYMAKENGKGQYQVFQPEMHAKALARLELKTDLQRALDAGEFTLRYQPIMDLARGDMAGMEALMRWEHPQRGTVQPLDFVSLLEDTGLIVQVGRQVLAEACAWASRMQRECPREPPLSMAVNVSACQLQRPEFIEEVRVVLEQSGIVPGSLTLELTESVMMQDMEVSLMRLHALRALGVKLAIDDFGTGYSSLNYLRQFPVDILKIDRSFLSDPNPEVAELTDTIVHLARMFNLKAVAEGVESPGQVTRLQGLSCEFGQGFHFAKPLRSGEILAMAEAQSGLLGAVHAPAAEIA
jgi:diguanylate cyclase (GGDEF)-like protein/PAS domain S-box-containing protein